MVGSVGSIEKTFNAKMPVQVNFGDKINQLLKQNVMISQIETVPVALKLAESVANKTVVQVSTSTDRLRSGSGVVINNRVIGKMCEITILTNAHVTDSRKNNIGQKSYITLADGRKITGKVVASGKESAISKNGAEGLEKKGSADLSVVKFLVDKNSPIAKVATAKIGTDATEGQSVLASGFPFDMDKATTKKHFSGSVSKVTTKLPHGYTVTLTNQSNYGMSGGGTFDSDSKLIGINGLLGHPVIQEQNSKGEFYKWAAKEKSAIIPVSIVKAFLQKNNILYAH